MGYEDPINPNFEATTEMYQRNVNEAMTRIKRMKEIGDPKKICIMMATHNEDTVRFVIKKYASALLDDLFYLTAVKFSLKISS